MSLMMVVMVVLVAAVVEALGLTLAVLAEPVV
jgi:hypothetical protein